MDSSSDLSKIETDAKKDIASVEAAARTAAADAEAAKSWLSRNWQYATAIAVGGLTLGVCIGMHVPL